jgi:hypothetical protein
MQLVETWLLSSCLRAKKCWGVAFLGGSRGRRRRRNSRSIFQLLFFLTICPLVIYRSSATAWPFL